MRVAHGQIDADISTTCHRPWDPLNRSSSSIRFFGCIEREPNPFLSAWPGSILLENATHLQWWCWSILLQNHFPLCFSWVGSRRPIQQINLSLLICIHFMLRVASNMYRVVPTLNGRYTLSGGFMMGAARAVSPTYPPTQQHAHAHALIFYVWILSRLWRWLDSACMEMEPMPLFLGSILHLCCCPPFTVVLVWENEQLKSLFLSNLMNFAISWLEQEPSPSPFSLPWNFLWGGGWLTRPIPVKEVETLPHLAV